MRNLRSKYKTVKKAKTKGQISGVSGHNTYQIRLMKTGIPK